MTDDLPKITLSEAEARGSLAIKISIEIDRVPRPEDTPSPGCCPNCGSPWARGIEMGVSSYEWFPTCGCSVVSGPGTIRFDPVPCDHPGLLLRTAIANARAREAEIRADVERALRAEFQE